MLTKTRSIFIMVAALAICGCSKDDSSAKKAVDKAGAPAPGPTDAAPAVIQWSAEVPTVRLSKSGISIAGNQLDALIAADDAKRKASGVRVPVELYAALQDIRKVIDKATAAGKFSEDELGKLVVRVDSDVEVVNVFDVVGSAFRVGFRSLRLAGPDDSIDGRKWLHLASTRDPTEEYEFITVLITTDAVWIGAAITSERVMLQRENGTLDEKEVVKIVSSLVEARAKSFPLEIELTSDYDVSSADLVTVARLLEPITAEHALVFVLPSETSVRFRE